MNRREVLGALGVTAAGLAALAGTPARADEPTGPHQHGELDKCAKACADCMNSCTSCFHHCAHQLADGKKEHAVTMQTCNDCAEICAAAAKIVGRHGPLSGPVCDACARSCDTCAAACEKFASDEHMKACAKACRDCARACREMLKHVGHEQAK
jgi:hypothetical protein